MQGTSAITTTVPCGFQVAVLKYDAPLSIQLLQQPVCMRFLGLVVQANDQTFTARTTLCLTCAAMPMISSYIFHKCILHLASHVPGWVAPQLAASGATVLGWFLPCQHACGQRIFLTLPGQLAASSAPRTYGHT